MYESVATTSTLNGEACIAPPETMNDRIREEIDILMKMEGLVDDITMIMFNRGPVNDKEIDVNCMSDAIDSIRSRSRRILGKLDMIRCGL